MKRVHIYVYGENYPYIKKRLKEKIRLSNYFSRKNIFKK